ncbi:PREDICTED: aquaporin-11-like [Cyprinodon variegatus]|uniref:Aquaporin n=1 Tax=Cyprinodon variegatus TaxID=28743 RepID=A0A3Q2CW56_CYPVA|nr:PREDICTED: aquaporin-11-like [Cyprinodon variegatus]
MADLWVSLGVLAAAVLLCEAARCAAARLLRGVYWTYLLEAVSTFQLCCCTQELKLLGESIRLDLSTSLTLTYFVTFVHLSTFREATCNPAAALESFCRGASSVWEAALLISLQMGAAVAAQGWAATVWSLGLSDMHLRHQKFGFRCFDPLGGTPLEAAAVEMFCAFTVQAVATHIHRLDERLRVHCFAAVITALVYAGGSISGAVFNPALAFSIQFPCSGHTYLEYCFIYWLGPILGMASCILLFEKIIPFLSGKSTIGMHSSNEQKEKMQ